MRRGGDEGEGEDKGGAGEEADQRLRACGGRDVDGRERRHRGRGLVQASSWCAAGGGRRGLTGHGREGRRGCGVAVAVAVAAQNRCSWWRGSRPWQVADAAVGVPDRRAGSGAGRALLYIPARQAHDNVARCPRGRRARRTLARCRGVWTRTLLSVAPCGRRARAGREWCCALGTSAGGMGRQAAARARQRCKH